MIEYNLNQLVSVEIRDSRISKKVYYESFKFPFCKRLEYFTDETYKYTKEEALAEYDSIYIDESNKVYDKAYIRLEFSNRDYLKLYFDSLEDAIRYKNEHLSKYLNFKTDGTITN